MAGHHHRSSLSKHHKAFKSKHATKGALKRLNKGRVEREVANNKPIKVKSKLDRKNTARQLRAAKVLESLENRKLFEGSNGAHKIVVVIPLTPDLDAGEMVTMLLNSVDMDVGNGVVPRGNEPFVRNFKVDTFKSNLKIIVPDMSDFLSILDAAKIADFVVFGLSGVSEVDEQFGEQILRAVELQGVSSCIGAVPNLSKVHEKEKFQLDAKQSLESYFSHFFPGETRIYNLEKMSDSRNALRLLCQKLPRPVHWRDSRGYLVADQIDVNDNGIADTCELIVSGTVRGAGFNPNRLVHIPELGDFNVSKIERLSSSSRGQKSRDILDLDLQNIFTPNELCDTLEEFAPSELGMEESDNSDVEYGYDQLQSARFDDHGYLPGEAHQQRVIKVPKGTSEYQARWYVDDDDEEQEGVEEEEEEMDMLMDDDGIPNDEVNMAIDDNSGQVFEEGEDTDELQPDTFVDLSPEEEERQLEEYRKLEVEDREFPDEIELHPLESGIERLKRYRGLKSLSNCVWEVDERDPERPEEWRRIFRILNYKNTRNRILKETAKEAQVVAGDRVKLYIVLPRNLLPRITDPQRAPFAVYGLLLHEHKNAVVNFFLQRWESYDKPVPSLEPLIVQHGARRYTINPLFSSASKSPNNVHKFERFLQPATIAVASCIAPTDFSQSPAIFFKPSSADPKGIELVGQGTFLNADHTRILAKRAILTGQPFRFHRSVVTVRYMFFNPRDIEWFKSIPLFTKSGRSGFIKESLGTHGYFKATFDGKLSAQDVVAMSLYKRMWPRLSHPWIRASTDEVAKL